MLIRRAVALLFVLTSAATAACGSATPASTSASTTGSGGSAGGSSMGTGGSAGSATATTGSTGGARPDAGLDAASDGDSTGSDGTPTRVSCTSNFGSALTTGFGRMDGYLVSIVPTTVTHGCNADSGHVHLQIKILDAVYDVAVNTDVLYFEEDLALPDGPWTEGWHTGVSLDYAQTLGLHSSAFTATNPTAITQKIEGELASTNHISVFATGYGPTGAHDVHRNTGHTDGAIILDPLSPKAHALLFCFSDQSF